ncbi:MAG: hypothetical protein HCA25_00130 (plasmid) [Dolichospermum sp. DET50]|nr:hypothetical protein [Dolichospermum sp. DET66]MBS3035915.1 hypothetical protein [Dolichospermum sp. DET67]MBS3041083.1 hypothetical protein [Dolichospermum sp. DET50]QSX70967.1 MAG: hypothetical protein EZY12_26850 [Dolichospermum sp. DET69]
MTNLSTTSISYEPETKETLDIDLHSKIQFEQAAVGAGVSSLSASLTQSHSLETTAYQLPEPSMRIRYGVYWFRVGLSIFVLLSMLFSLGGCSLNATTVNWNKAVDVVSTPVLEQVIRDNTNLNPKASAENILIWNVSEKDGKLTLFNFNTPDVCGALGCLYAGYWLRNDKPITQVFLSYLNPTLPPGKQLFVVGENRNQSLPCIKVLQTEKQQLRQLNFCFNGNRYQVADSQLLATINKSVK